MLRIVCSKPTDLDGAQAVFAKAGFHQALVLVVLAPVMDSVAGSYLLPAA